MMVSRRFFGFAALSGTGWLLDVLATTVLVTAGLTPFWASFLGAGLAVTFVYIVSRLSIFGEHQIGTAQDYGLYVLWQILAISAASVLVAMLAQLLQPVMISLGRFDDLALATGAGKVLVTPLTLSANYMFMKWLTGRARRFQAPQKRELS